MILKYYPYLLPPLGMLGVSFPTLFAPISQMAYVPHLVEIGLNLYAEHTYVHAWTQFYL